MFFRLAILSMSYTVCSVELVVDLVVELVVKSQTEFFTYLTLLFVEVVRLVKA